MLDISIRDEHATFGRERRKDTGAWWKEREKVRWWEKERGKGSERGEGEGYRRRVDFPEGRR